MSPNDAHFILHSIGRLLLAAALGALVGFERERKHKPAGLRTIMLIGFASAFFTLISEGLARVHGGDPQRIAAQLIPGIGFLGAGAIIQSRAAVTGLTTAATIFAMASVGMAAGAGMPILAIIATALLLTVLVAVGWAEARSESKVQTISLSIACGNPSRCLLDLQKMAAQHRMHLRDFHVGKSDSGYVVDFEVEAPGGTEALVLQKIEEIERAEK
jgi:putative Mg2+ transporter-C (MgtC) family protein